MPQPTRLADAFGAAGAPSALTRWFDARLTEAAEGLAALSEILRPRRRIVFEEQTDGAFLSPFGSAWLENGRWTSTFPLRGAEVVFRLAPHRFVFRELELPTRAGEFLDGVVRAQIDRLIPWRAKTAAFGCGAPTPSGADRILIVVAATKQEWIAPLLGVPAESVTVATARDDDAAPIVVATARVRASLRVKRWRFTLAAALAGSLACGVAALAADWTLGAALEEQAGSLKASLDQRRAALLRRQRASEDPAAQALDARKRARPAAVLVVEALSRAIPDDAYLTEMQWKGDKVEIAGVAADAAALVNHLEQSAQFGRATFAAPTTRIGEDRESFRIEAEVAPVVAVSP